MTGPEHYQSAERWAYKAENTDARGGTETAESCAAVAQVHATLAGTAFAAASEAVRFGRLPVKALDPWWDLLAPRTTAAEAGGAGQP